MVVICKHLRWQSEHSDAELYSFPSLLGGDDWASGGPALCRRRAHPPGMPRPPLLFPCAVRDGAPQTLTKLSVLGSESSYNILSYLLTWISFARTRIIGCTCVHPCPMLGPPPAWDLPLFSNSNANSSLPFIFLRRKLVVYRRKVPWPW